MATCDKLLKKARQSPDSLTFDELCKLAECQGWLERPTGGGTSHRLFLHPKLGNGPGSLMNFQRRKGKKAKPYQINQLLDAIDAIAIIDASKKNGK